MHNCTANVKVFFQTLRIDQINSALFVGIIITNEEPLEPLSICRNIDKSTMQMSSI